MEFSRHLLDISLELLKRNYHKILSVNLSTDTFEPIIVDPIEWEQVKSKDHSISVFFTWFICSDLISARDRELFNRFVDLEHLKKLFTRSPKPYHIVYKRKINGDFHWAMMQIMPSFEYAEGNQSVVLFVRDIDEIYNEEYYYLKKMQQF